MDDVSKVMCDLELNNQSQVTSQCLEKILNLLDNEESDRDTTVKNLLEQGLVSKLFDIFQKTSDKAKIAQVIAELAKTEDARVPCVCEGFIPPLLNLLSLDDVITCTQACRALGNICFDNDAARAAVADNDGVKKLVDLLKEAATYSAEGATRLRIVACGLLLNLTNTHETIEEKALSLGAMDVLKNYLELYSGDEGVAQMALLSVGSLADSDVGKTKLLESSILETIVTMIGTECNENLDETILELLTNLAENDQVKLVLAEAGAGDRLLAMLHDCQQRPDEERTQIEKLVSDLIVLLLTGDESMEILYNNGRGQIYQESLDWLQSPDEQLYVSGALVIGNFARNDSKCLKLVEMGITETLLTLLERHSNVGDVSPTLQHAVFSVLRNLAIPAANKPQMLDCDVINRILPHIDTEFSSVQFKLLGTLRMVIVGQESAAKCLGTKEEFLQKLVSWCTVEDHAGVKGEANRLVASLIKNSHNSEVMLAIIRNGGIPHLISMATSEHAVMQNEALIALTLTAVSVLDAATESFIKADIISIIQELLLTKYDSLPQILCNVLSLLTHLTKSDELLELIRISDLPAIISNMKCHEDVSVSQQANGVAAILNKA